MPKVGLEPTRGLPHRILSPARLPVPPLRPGQRVRQSCRGAVDHASMPPQRRFAARVSTDMPLAWCIVDGGRPGVPAAARCVDISSSGIAFLSEAAAQVDDGILIRLDHELLASGLAVQARVVRVARAPGGYRLAAAFEALDAARRAMLGRFVV